MEKFRFINDSEDFERGYFQWSSVYKEFFYKFAEVVSLYRRGEKEKALEIFENDQLPLFPDFV